MAAILMDYDGTLHDALVVYSAAFRQVYEAMVTEGAAAPRIWKDGEIARWIGFTAEDMWQDFRPDLPVAVRRRYSDAIGRAMIDLTLRGDAQLYPGVPAMLSALVGKGHTLVFLSNCKREYMETHREMFGLNRWFSGYYCSEDFGFDGKPEIFKTVQQDFNQDFIVVGDRAMDMEVAEVFGLPSVGCAYGYGRPGELDGASVIVKSPGEIAAAVDGIVDGR